jgi:hypothetical protein
MARRKAQEVPTPMAIVRTRSLYCVARNASGRPTVQHKLPEGVASITCCGVEITGWSRAYMNFRIEELLCRRAACRA